MPVDSLDRLLIVIDKWREGKRYRCESMPAGLLERVRRAAKVYGTKKVIKATRVRRERLVEAADRSYSRSHTVNVVPTFSRIEISAPVNGRLPLVEAESVTGVKLRIFFSSTETMGLLSS